MSGFFMNTTETTKIIKQLAKIALVILILGVTIKALINVIINAIPLIFWMFILLGVYGLYLLITEKENKNL